MEPLFLFGTLRHLPLLKAVLGEISHLSLEEDDLPGFDVSGVSEGPFPLIQQSPEASARGLVVSGATKDDLARLDFYEGAFGYQRDSVMLKSGKAARAYFPQPNRYTPEGPWALDAWARDWGDISVLSAQEVMGYRGEKPPEEIGEMFPMIRARAWSRLNAANSQHGDLTLSGQIKVISRRRAYAKYFGLDDYILRHELFDGGMSGDVARAVFLAPDAALVLPYDPHRDRVLLVEQVRMGPLARGDRALWQLEPIAGRLDPGEKPEDAVRREALEEAGLTLGPLETVAETYCSPGNSTEFYYIYVGLASLPDDAAGLGGLDTEHEDIRSHVLSFEELMDMCARLQIANAPLVMAAYWLAHNRERLRADVL